MKDGRGQQCTTELLPSILPQAKGERTVASLLVNKLSAMSFQGMHFFRVDAHATLLFFRQLFKVGDFSFLYVTRHADIDAIRDGRPDALF